MKKYLTLSILFLSISWASCAQDELIEKYYRHLAYNHVSPHVEIKGIHEIGNEEATKTSHYVFKYNSKKQLVEILNNHYHSERKHPLASIGAYRTTIEYSGNMEIRKFHDPNGKRVSNDREVFKEVYLRNEKGFKYELTYYNEEDQPMESNWGITRYQWNKQKKMVIEKRFDVRNEMVNVSPYFSFGVTGIVYDKAGLPKGHYNLDENLKPVANGDGVASYQDTYDEKGNHVKYTYHDAKGELVKNQWRFAKGVKEYDDNGNQTGLSQYDEIGELLREQPTLSNVNIKLAQPASVGDTVQIKEMAIGYLVALQELKPDLMRKVMHDSLAKRTIGYDRETRSEVPRPTTFDQMVEFAESWNKSGAKFPFNPSNEVVILDVYQRMATVKLISDNWIEYLHLMKLNNEWKIINLVWQYKDASRYPD